MFSNKNNKDVNSWPVLLANVYLCTLPSVIVIMLPLLIGGMVESLGYSEQQGGFIVSGDMAGYTLGTVAAYFFIDKINWRHGTAICLVVMALANLLCGWASDFTSLLSLRFVSGMAGGVVTALMFAVIAQTKKPDSAYGLWLVSQTILAGIGSITFAAILGRWGLGGVFVIFSALVATGLCMIMMVPTGAIKSHLNDPDRSSGHWRKWALGVVAIAIIYVAIVGVYSYIERMGVAATLSMAQIGECFLVMTVAGGVGGLAAACLGTRYGRVRPVILAGVGFVMAYLMLNYSVLSYYRFMLIISLFFAAWSFLLPYLMGALAAVDASGKALAMGNGALGMGLALGPLIAALIVSKGYSLLILLGLMTFVFGLALAIPLLITSEEAE